MDNDYNTSDSVSDLLDRFNSNRSEQKCRYRYAHLPKPLMTNNIQQMQKLHNNNDVQRLERSQSASSFQSSTSGLRNRFNSNDIIATTTSAWALNSQHQQCDSLPLNRQKFQHQRPSSPSLSLPTYDKTFYSKINGSRNDNDDILDRQTNVALLERDTLHRDIWRNSLSSRRGTRNFVINPLYDE